MAVFYVAAGLNHFIHPQFYRTIMPPWLGWHGMLIDITGVCEILFGLLLILSLLVGVISYVFSIPASILQGISMLHTVKSNDLNGPSGVIGTIVFVLHSLAYISQLLLYLLPTVGLAFQYFNLVEMKEAKGLMSDIETFGQVPPATPQEENY